MRIMLDTNVLISIVIFNSNRLKNMLLNICDNHTLIISSYILQELENVIKRKFPNKNKELNEFLYNLPYQLYYIPPNIQYESVIEMRDKKDIPILYSAEIADVDILITGDKDFKDVDIEKPKILTPTEFLEKYLY